MNKQHILDEIKRTAAANGGVPLGTAKFLKETGIKNSDWLGTFWPRWGDALREAGFQPNKLQTAYSQDTLIEKLISLTRELGHFPVRAELAIKSRSDGDFPWSLTFEKHFGRLGQRAAKILDYCRNRAGYEDIIALCEPIAPLARHDSTKDEIKPEEVVGFV